MPIPFGLNPFGLIGVGGAGLGYTGAAYLDDWSGNHNINSWAPDDLIFGHPEQLKVIPPPPVMAGPFHPTSSFMNAQSFNPNQPAWYQNTTSMPPTLSGFMRNKPNVLEPNRFSNQYTNPLHNVPRFDLPPADTQLRTNSNSPVPSQTLTQPQGQPQMSMEEQLVRKMYPNASSITSAGIWHTTGQDQNGNLVNTPIDVGGGKNIEDYIIETTPHHYTNLGAQLVNRRVK